MPLLECEKMAGESFPRPFAGVDEAGRGCLAGPVVAAAVILPESFSLPGLTDSKKLSEKKRLALEPLVKSTALAWGIGVVWPQDIDRMNILRASLESMCRAIRVLKIHPSFLAIDGNQPVPLDTPQRTVVGGDAKVPEISAASILAKTFRDRLMIHLDARYPGYGFAVHKGYGTKVHLEALRAHGPCRMHRMTFRGVRQEEAPKERSLCLPGM
ncbi:ribonuclease HII [Desulfobaculum bizertense]|uniref:Ribonuclease HII n=1 Tax=Desulfobaculum bizertense DSM 18034 TaxID=1121442 RepID=A0A1T4VHX5_9BACT|nr:ribonuclease HII [Desulfobaculum bizertense]UIJ37879.1 ribonuclease HII [Desulfobaculum bizertense]SKA64570.1 RNase HII [Desulfobaculum bizertense DSM 18034]